MKSLSLVINLPPFWDGAKVEWKREDAPTLTFICPPPKVKERCGACKSAQPPVMWSGLRHPLPGETFESTKTKIGRWGHPVEVPTTIAAYPVYDLVAFRCPQCGNDQVWDQRTNEWWDLEPNDYTATGSARPAEVTA